MLCTGGVGGVTHGGAVKLKNSDISIWAESRWVSDDSPKRVSISFKIAV